VRLAFFFTFTLTILCGVVFALAPGVDIETARLFYDHGFAGERAAFRAARSVFYFLPLVVCAGFILWGALPLKNRPQRRSVLFVALAMALGPGLLVNVALKDHSHRPRPSQTIEFGGAWAFRPVGRFDGACVKNCSFVSGETSSAFWLVAPASLAPPPFRIPAVAAALAVGVATGVLRMAAGGHYLSDVTLAALFTVLLILGLRFLFYPELRGRVFKL
jgi:lipid A 4'-phosphatase